MSPAGPLLWRSGGRGRDSELAGAGSLGITMVGRRMLSHVNGELRFGAFLCQADWLGGKLNNRTWRLSALPSRRELPQPLTLSLRPEVSEFSSSPCVSGTSQAAVPVLELRVRVCVSLCDTIPSFSQTDIRGLLFPALVPQTGVPVVRLGPVTSWGQGRVSAAKVVLHRHAMGLHLPILLLHPSCLS